MVVLIGWLQADKREGIALVKRRASGSGFSRWRERASRKTSRDGRKISRDAQTLISEDDVERFRRDGVVPEQVCPKFVAGSHRWDKLFYPRVFKDGENYDYKGAGYEPVPEIEGNPGDYDIPSWSLEPGGAVSRTAGWATMCVSASGRENPRRPSPRWASI